jgi:hypothetical protein
MENFQSISAILVLRFNIPHTFSIGLRSGELCLLTILAASATDVVIDTRVSYDLAFRTQSSQLEATSPGLSITTSTTDHSIPRDLQQFLRTRVLHQVIASPAKNWPT